MKPFNHSMGILAVSVLFSSLRTAPARAWPLPSYDLDSEVYMGSDIVEADPIPGQVHSRYDYNDDVKVSRSYHGGLTVGQRIRVLGLGEYDTSRTGHRRIGAGDHLTLLLQKADPHDPRTTTGPIAHGPEAYGIAGVRMAVDGRVRRFFQYSNPGPYELEWPTNAAPDAARFREELAASIHYVDGIRSLLQGKASDEDLPRLLAILKERQVVREMGGFRLEDAIAEAARNQIVSLNSLPALADALTIVGSKLPPDPTWAYISEFCTPAGRDYLIRVIGDHAQPLQRRLGCAYAIKGAYDSMRMENNGDYVARVLGLCDQIQVRNTPLVLCAVLDGLDELVHLDVFNGGKHIGDPAKPGIQADVPTLQVIHAAATSEAVKFRIERLVLDAGAFAAYRRLASPCVPVLSLLEPADSPAGYGQFACRIHVRWEGRSPLAISLDGKEVSGSVVFLNTESLRRWALPWRLAAGRNTTLEWIGINEQQFAAQVQLDPPSDLVHGHYRVFLEFSRDGKVVSVGHYMEADL